MLIATAGHVDHGKTTLIKALTGTDTDRLVEEKKRGLTIELGFAYLEGPEGLTLGFVDVPGHHRFVRTMAAGVAGIDLALLVVAADDGVMPQTLEHIAILNLLGISSCIVAITRIDRVKPQRIEQVREQVLQCLAGTSLVATAVPTPETKPAAFNTESPTTPSANGSVENRPVATGPVLCIPVSVPQDTGIANLKATLLNYALAHREAQQRRAKAGHYFRMAIDRAFSLRGTGTVVTGTVISGDAAAGERMKILSGTQQLTGPQQSRIRSLHINGAPAKPPADSKPGSAHNEARVQSGQRAALNLPELEKTQVPRGSWIVSPELAFASTCVDVSIQLLGTEARALRHWSSAHCHSGASSISCRIALYDIRSLPPGETHYAQLVFEQPQHMLFGDRFVVRDQSATRVIGGGKVIDPLASRHKNFRRNRVAALHALDSHDPQLALKQALAQQPAGLSAEDFRLSRNFGPDAFARLLRKSNVSITPDSSAMRWLIEASTMEKATQAILQHLKQFQSDYPSLAGPTSTDLQNDCALHKRLYDIAITHLLSNDKVNRKGTAIQISGYLPTLDADHQALLDKLGRLIDEDALKPPPIAELTKALAMERDAFMEAVTPITQAGFLVQISNNRLYHPQALQTLANLAVALAAQTETGFDAKAFRDASGIGRNMSIDVLEYLDQQGITRRIGDRRTVFNNAKNNSLH